LRELLRFFFASIAAARRRRISYGARLLELGRQLDRAAPVFPWNTSEPIRSATVTADVNEPQLGCWSEELAAVPDRVDVIDTLG
jgi:hypothetical protein